MFTISDNSGNAPKESDKTNHPEGKTLGFYLLDLISFLRDRLIAYSRISGLYFFQDYEDT
jgi:hypothetical protein